MSTRTRSAVRAVAPQARRWPRLRRVLCGVCLTATGLVLAPAAASAASAASYTYSGSWGGNVTTLTHVTNVTVEGLPDARLAGTITNFQTTDPAYSCLNGSSLNVWTAQNEFPNEFVVHNGDQGSQCAYGTWTFPAPSYTYYVTESAWIPQQEVDGAPLLPEPVYAALGLSCANLPLDEEVIVGYGDGNTGFSGPGADRAFNIAEIGWNGSSITSVSTLFDGVATTSVTAYYFVYVLGVLVPVGSCNLGVPGTQLSPAPAQTGPNTFSLEVKAQNNVAPPPLNPPLDGALSVSVSGSATNPQHATFSFTGNVKDFPSYGVQVTGPAGNSSQTILSSVAGYGTTISYPVVAALLSCNLVSSCTNVSGQVGV
jgi:hypothetical protein